MATGKNEDAGLQIVEALFHDWLESEGFDNDKAFDLSRGISKKLCELEHEGYLVIYKHGTHCSNCGASWPKADGEPHVTMCKKCCAKRIEQYRRADVDLVCAIEQEAFKKGLLV